MGETAFPHRVPGPGQSGDHARNHEGQRAVDRRVEADHLHPAFILADGQEDAPGGRIDDPPQHQVHDHQETQRQEVKQQAVLGGVDQVRHMVAVQAFIRAGPLHEIGGLGEDVERLAAARVIMAK